VFFATAGSARESATLAVSPGCGPAPSTIAKRIFVEAVEGRDRRAKGADVILDMVGGDYIQRNMSAASGVGGASSTSPIRAACRRRSTSRPMLMLIETAAVAACHEPLARALESGERRPSATRLLREVWPVDRRRKNLRPVVDHV